MAKWQLHLWESAATIFHFLARILAVADSFDAMTDDSPYRLAMSIDEAVEELVKNKNTQFDADIVETLIKII